jgi:transposase
LITGAAQPNDPVEVPIMRAFDPEVVEVVWAAVAGLLPERPDTHPLGCHRRRTPDRVCFQAILIRLVTGCSWVVTETLMGGVVSDTTVRARRDEWIAAGVFEQLVTEALDAYDRIVGVDGADACGDASQHKAPVGGPDTGPNYWDRGKQGWKWSLVTDTAGIPVGWTTAGANRPDASLLAPTLDDVARRGFLGIVERLHLDAGYHWAPVLADCDLRGLVVITPPRRTRSKTGHGRFAKGRRRQGYRAVAHRPDRHRWPIERTNSWLANFGQLRRNTDRTNRHRQAQLALAITLLLAAKLIDWRNRWTPIR